MITKSDLKNLNISADKFTFVEEKVSRYDQKMNTKPMSFGKEALIRFCKNRSSVIGSIIILVLVVFAFVGPFMVPFGLSYSDNDYLNMKPKGSIFGDGTYVLDGDEKTFLYWSSIGVAIADTTGNKFRDGEVTLENSRINDLSPIRSYEEYTAPDGKTRYKMVIDSYYRIGFKIMTLSETEYNALMNYQAETGIQVIYPMLPKPNQRNMNTWFYADNRNMPKLVKGELVEEYLRDNAGEPMFYYPSGSGGTQRMVRLLTYNYYVYKNGFEPVNYLGTDNLGQDVFIRLCGGIRTSLVLGIGVTIMTFIIGAFVGAVEGFFGGWVDMLIERIKDVVAGIPFIVLATLFHLHFVVTGKVTGFQSLLFAFVLTGWVSNSSLLRTQFYRFKHQEHVLAAKTLGAGNLRLIFKHIFPNALGTVVTACALDIPYTIMTESSLSLLGLVQLETPTTSSLGNMLASGHGNMVSNAHLLITPAIVLALLMISFNLFGNGLRDALNPTLRGADE